MTRISWADEAMRLVGEIEQVALDNGFGPHILIEELRAHLASVEGGVERQRVWVVKQRERLSAVCSTEEKANRVAAGMLDGWVQPWLMDPFSEAAKRVELKP